jgi:hypothetical protein
MSDASTTPTKGRLGIFNVPIAGSIVDVIFMIVAIAATSYLWYNAKGIPKIQEARAQVEITAEEAEETIDARKAEIREKRAEIRLAEVRRDSLVARLNHLKDVAIPGEISGIAAAQEKSQELTTNFLTLRGRLGSQQDQLRETRLIVEQLTETANGLATDQAVLRDTVFSADQARQTLAIQVEEMVEYRERDPWSMFPVSASLAAYAEFGEDANFLSFSLSKDIYSLGKVDLGLSGALGFGNEQGTSVREVGAYANIPLWFRKASIDLGAGFSSVRIGTDNASDDPYVSAMLRFAPYYRERAFLLLGTKYSHDTLNYLVGIGFGRR